MWREHFPRVAKAFPTCSVWGSDSRERAFSWVEKGDFCDEMGAFFSSEFRVQSLELWIVPCKSSSSELNAKYAISFEKLALTIAERISSDSRGLSRNQKVSNLAGNSCKLSETEVEPRGGAFLHVSRPVSVGSKK